MIRPTCVMLACVEPDPGDAAVEFVEAHFDLRHVRRVPDPDPRGWPDELTERIDRYPPDCLFSFLSPVIVPRAVLDRVGTAVNVHPAPPRWPGVGAPCYALYEGDRTFGATVHLMEPRPDTGTILGVREFDIVPGESQSSLLERARQAALPLFADVLRVLLEQGRPVPSGHQWSGPPHTRRQFDRWLTLDPAASAEEVERKIHAAAHPDFPSPVVILHGHRFGYLGPAGE
jgi:methionyl-tRNA formyltransferase